MGAFSPTATCWRKVCLVKKIRHVGTKLKKTRSHDERTINPLKQPFVLEIIFVYHVNFGGRWQFWTNKATVLGGLHLGPGLSLDWVILGRSFHLLSFYSPQSPVFLRILLYFLPFFQQTARTHIEADFFLGP